MKPNWADAPRWANYRAMDEDGDWYWYETKPELTADVWVCHSKTMFCGGAVDGWKDSLQERPK